MNNPSASLIVALDFPDPAAALALARQIAPARPWAKVGLELLMRTGPEIVRELRALGLPVFLDGKFHDIPNTVAGAVRGAVSTGARMINVHAAGGVRMMRAARDAADQTAEAQGLERPLLIAVTVLTSLSADELRDEVGYALPMAEQVVAFARRAQEAGLDGVVASVEEVAAIKAACGMDFITVTPGIRPATGIADDQRRISTPTAAVQAGSNYLVVGRPITQADDPLAVCQKIIAEIAESSPAKR